MTTNDLLLEVETLTPAQLNSVYSFIYLLKHPNFLFESLKENENIEPFTNERDALDFVNYYAEKNLNETRCAMGNK